MSDSITKRDELFRGVAEAIEAGDLSRRFEAAMLIRGQAAEIARLQALVDQMRRAANEAAAVAQADERERCARIAEAQYPQPHRPVGWFEACKQIAAAIRGGKP